MSMSQASSSSNFHEGGTAAVKWICEKVTQKILLEKGLWLLLCMQLFPSVGMKFFLMVEFLSKLYDQRRRWKHNTFQIALCRLRCQSRGLIKLFRARARLRCCRDGNLGKSIKKVICGKILPYNASCPLAPRRSFIKMSCSIFWD